MDKKDEYAATVVKLKETVEPVYLNMLRDRLLEANHDLASAMNERYAV